MLWIPGGERLSCVGSPGGEALGQSQGHPCRVQVSAPMLCALTWHVSPGKYRSGGHGRQRKEVGLGLWDSVAGRRESGKRGLLWGISGAY